MFLKWPDSLRLQLLRWLLPPLLLLLCVNAWFSNRAAVATADEAFDRLLTASAEAIAEDVEFHDGAVVVDLPYAALELLETNIQERIFYRVVAPNGLTVTGYEDLPLPKSGSGSGEAAGPTLYADSYRGERVHLVALNKKLYGTDMAAPVVVIVAETGESRDALSRQILFDGLIRQSLLVAAAAVLVWLGLVWGVRPLTRLRDSVVLRAPSDLSPIDPTNVQSEVRPLIEAMNQHTARIERLLAARRRMIADASHQMRTPLSEMRTQIEYSLRQDRPELSHQTLREVQVDIDRLSRLLSQLLLQAHADPDGLPEQRNEAVDLIELARQTTLDHVAAARKKAMDLSFHSRESVESPDHAWVAGNGLLLREMLANLIENAIGYGHERGSVAVRVSTIGTQIVLEVEDDGPGISEAERDKVFERFYRSPAVSSAHFPGSGLGLSIVRDICAAHQAVLKLLTPSGGKGLTVRVSMAETARPVNDAAPS